jgi:hypothetical protein
MSLKRVQEFISSNKEKTTKVLAYSLIAIVGARLMKRLWNLNKNLAKRRIYQQKIGEIRLESQRAFNIFIEKARSIEDNLKTKVAHMTVTELRKELDSGLLTSEQLVLIFAERCSTIGKYLRERSKKYIYI